MAKNKAANRLIWLAANKQTYIPSKNKHKKTSHKMSIIRGFEKIKIETPSHAIALHKKSFHRHMKKWSKPKIYSK